jgi:hypothetical protein
MRSLPVCGLLLAIACGDPVVTPLPDATTIDSGQPKDAEPADVPEIVDVGVDAGFPDLGTPDSGEEPMDATPIDTGPEDGGFGCDELPEPVITELVGPTAYKDVAFDADGNLVGSDAISIWKSKSDGTRQLFVPNRPAYGGLRYLLDGTLAIADESQGGIVLVQPNGAQEVLVSGLGYAYGLAIDLSGRIWLANHDAILRIDPMTRTSTVVLRSGEVPSPRSITFDNTYETLFVGSTNSPTIYAIPLDANGDPTFPQVWGSLPNGAGWVDGLAMDECGNLYVADYLTQSLYIMPPNGVGALLHAWQNGSYGHGLEFGSGIGGWDEYSLYLPQPYQNSEVARVWLGVRGKPRPFP